MASWNVFLGGHDLEMLEIKKLLAGRADVKVYDAGLSWGATAARYERELRELLNTQNAGKIVLVELKDDLPRDISRDCLNFIDHHGDQAGASTKTSLEQVFELLKFPQSAWTRDHALVAANDRGHIKAMRMLGATVDEMREIRRRDRESQGITQDQEERGKLAAGQAEWYAGRRLAVVKLPHSRTATVTDAMDDALGGAGYQNLLIQSPSSTHFFGDGRAISALTSHLGKENCWSGGELPDRGFWGTSRSFGGPELIPLIEKAITSVSSQNITVDHYRNILTWPVLLCGDPNHGSEREKAPIDAWVDRFQEDGKWKKVPDEKLSSPPYEPVVYFHPFVRDFLFGDGNGKRDSQPTRKLVRDDVKGIRVELGKWADPGTVLTLIVERIELYLCKPCTAILVVEFSNQVSSDLKEPPITPSALRLDHVLNFQDQVRRQYPPFWWNTGEPGLCLKSLTWLNADGQEISMEDTEYSLHQPRDQFVEFTKAGSEPPVFKHWQWLFVKSISPFKSREELKNTGHRHNEQKPRLFFQQVQDERIPAMSYIGVTDPSQITPGDMDRITFFDAAGSDEYPYNKAFLDKRRERYTYDRFSHYGTTYLCCGYGFSVVGNSNDLTFNNVVFTHFRQHYFYMGLISHYQRATLIYFGDKMSESVKQLSGLGGEEERRDQDFLKVVEELQWQFLKFRSRGYFPEVTNQLQGKELYQFWMDTLETPRWFELVDTTSQRVAECLAEAETRRLTRLATWGVPVALVFTMVPVLKDISFPIVPQPYAAWGVATLVVILLSIFVFGIPSRFFCIPTRPLTRLFSKIRRSFWCEVLSSQDNHT